MSTGAKVGIAIAVAVVAGIIALVTAGFSMFETEVCDHLKAQTAITERLGMLTVCEHRMMITSEYDDDDTWGFALEGSKGVGRAIVRSVTTDDGPEKFLGVLLIVGGEEILVEGERPPAPTTH